MYQRVPCSPWLASLYFALTSVGFPVAAGAVARHGVPFIGRVEGVDTPLTSVTHARARASRVDGYGYPSWSLHGGGPLHRQPPHRVRFRDPSGHSGQRRHGERGGMRASRATRDPRSLHCGTRHHHRGNGSVRRSHRDRHPQALTRHEHRLDDRFLRGDDLRARWRQALTGQSLLTASTEHPAAHTLKAGRARGHFERGPTNERWWCVSEARCDSGGRIVGVGNSGRDVGFSERRSCTHADGRHVLRPTPTADGGEARHDHPVDADRRAG